MNDPNQVPEPAPGEPSEVQAVVSPAVQRFTTCRWRKAAEDDVPDHCTHRDVQPMAGTGGFDPEAWCGDCGFYKVKRAPRKRPDRERSFY